MADIGRQIPDRPPMSSEALQDRLHRLRVLEKMDCPTLEQTAPVGVKEIYDSFANDYERSEKLYFEKRVMLTGIAVKIGPDIHAKPAIEVSDCAWGRCYALCVFPDNDFYSSVHVGDRVVCRGNVVNAREPFGVTLKKCELLCTE